MVRTLLANYRFSILLLTGVFCGALTGLFFGETAKKLQPLADIFLNLVFCLIVPVVFFSIASAIANMENISKLKKVLLIFLTAVVVSGLLTCVLAIGTVSFIAPVAGDAIDFGKVTAAPAASLNLVNLFTVADFPLLMSKNNMLPLIIFTILFGISVSLLGAAGEPARRFLTQMSAIFSRMVSLVMYLAPVGIACYFASLISQLGGQVVASVARISIIFVCFTLLFFIITSTLYAGWGAGIQGVKAYWRNIWLPLTTAMGTCSSTACIPVNLLAAKQMGIPQGIADIIIPLGGSIHKNGVVSVQIMKIAFLLAVFHQPFGIDAMATAVLVAIVSGVIVGTIPSGGFIGEVFICTAFGFPPEAIPVIVIMGTLTDSFCTMLNVTSDTALAMVISRIVEGDKWLDNAGANNRLIG